MPQNLFVKFFGYAMAPYLIRRLLLLPFTLFFICLVNFVIINLAPNDPLFVTDISEAGDALRREGASQTFHSDERFLQFREFFGLTNPILFNLWPLTSQKQVEATLSRILQGQKMLSPKALADLRISFRDRARFILPKLFAVLNDEAEGFDKRALASNFIVQGGIRQALVLASLTEEERFQNQEIDKMNTFLRNQVISPLDSEDQANKKRSLLNLWFSENKEEYGYPFTNERLIKIFFFETRFVKYLSRVLTLDFGVMRNDPNKTVISEVTKRFKISLTLSVLPLFLTFFLCLFFGFIMAIYRKKAPDTLLNWVFLVLYALPVFVVAPFLIEKVALVYDFPFTSHPIPISGFHSPDNVFDKLTSWQRVLDVASHIFLPLIVIMYGSLAVQSRLTRVAVLDVLSSSYVLVSFAKGLRSFTVYFFHVGRLASITIVTAIAGSLGAVLGGALIVETLFEINGFGKFFYDAVVNRDYNVIMFSTLSGSFLSLLGYLMADVAYTLLDPRVTLD